MPHKKKIWRFIKEVCRDICIVALWGTSVVVTFALLTIIGFVLWFMYHDNKIFYEESFDREQWIANENSNDCERGKMYGSLVWRHLHTGMTKKEVIKLLGEPERWRVYHFPFSDKKCFKYPMGKCKWIPVENILLVCFKNDSVIDYFRSDSNDWGKTYYLNEIN